MTHILIPREPSTALLRPFIDCNTQELHEAWAAMIRIAEVQHARAGSQCLAQIEEPAQPVAPQGVPVGEIVIFGGDLKEVSWAGGKMPLPGTKLYAGAAPAAVAPRGERQWICPTRTVADLVNNLLTLDQALPIYGAQYIEKDGRRCAIAVPPTVSRERVKDGRWIGQGEELNAAVIWPRAERPAAVAGPVLDVRAIAAAVCQRVAELPDRNSPEDWPEAMLVTGQELIDVVTCELEQAQAAPALEAPAAPARIVADALIRLDAIYREEADCDEPPQRPDWLVNALHLAAAAPQEQTDAQCVAAWRQKMQDEREGDAVVAMAFDAGRRAAAVPQAPAALDELRQIAAIAACWGCDHPYEPGDTELLRRVKWAARQLRAVSQAPAAPAEAQRLAQFLQDRQTHLGSCRESAGTYNQQAWDDYERAWTMLLGMAAPAAPAGDAELLELAQAIVKFNREHGSILAVHIDNMADLVDERAAQAAAKGEHDAAD